MAIRWVIYHDQAVGRTQGNKMEHLAAIISVDKNQNHLIQIYTDYQESYKVPERPMNMGDAIQLAEELVFLQRIKGK